MPDVAKAAGAKVVGTGRSDFPNQVNNVVAFPGIFKGALEGRAKQITEEMKLAAALAIASLVPDNELNENNTVQEVQKYIKKVIEIRGFADQKIEKTMLLLLEEVGELAKSIRKNATNMRIDNDKINHYDTIESEIADVFIVLSSICNKLGIDLFKSIKDKEENIKRTWK